MYLLSSLPIVTPYIHHISFTSTFFSFSFLRSCRFFSRTGKHSFFLVTPIANNASGVASSVSGGQANVASGDLSSVVGGAVNEASGIQSAVGGGVGNNASGQFSAIGGGSSLEASGVAEFQPSPAPR